MYGTSITLIYVTTLARKAVESFGPTKAGFLRSLV